MLAEKKDYMQHYWASLGAFIAAFAVITQYYLMIDGKDVSLVPELTIHFFSYFTILTNTIVAICLSTHALIIRSKRRPFFERPGVITAIAVYITVVGLVYQIILRPLWDPQGLQMIVDELLHSVMPLFFLVYWYYYEKKQALKWGQFIPWLIYPLLYLVLILVLGNLSNFYPYPFVDVYTLGLYTVLINSAWLMVFFIALSLTFIAVGKRMGYKQ